VEKLFHGPVIDCLRGSGALLDCGVIAAANPARAANEERDMKKTLKAAVVAVAALSASVAHAGGPVLIEEGNDELIAEAPTSRIGILPVIGALILVCIIACGGGDDDTPDSDPDPK
jgi:hypothetical protein